MCFECFNKLPIFFYRGQEFLVWYNDKNCRVGFSELPHICNKYINKEVMSKEEIKKAWNTYNINGQIIKIKGLE